MIGASFVALGVLSGLGTPPGLRSALSIEGPAQETKAESGYFRHARMGHPGSKGPTKKLKVVLDYFLACNGQSRARFPFRREGDFPPTPFGLPKVFSWTCLSV